MLLPPLFERSPAKPAITLHEVLSLARVQLAVSRSCGGRFTLYRMGERIKGIAIVAWERTFGSSASGMMCL